MLLKSYEWGDPDAFPLVCVHGVTASANTYRRLAEERWGRHSRVIAFDLRGHGESGWSPPWNYATLLGDILESLDAMGIEQADWVGHSLGGRLILELAAREPQRIRRAVLLDPVIQISPELAFKRADEERADPIFDSVEAYVAGAHNIGDVDIKQLIAEAGDRWETLPDGRVKRRSCQPAVVTIMGEFASAPPPPQTLTVPTMVIYAKDFGLVTDEQLALYGDRFEPVPVPGLHLVTVTAFEETASAVERFLA